MSQTNKKGQFAAGPSGIAVVTTVGDILPSEPAAIQRVSITDIQFAAFGRWRELLTSGGVTLPSGKRHGPCPICGGEDRFRFDDQAGRGTYICSQCGAGDGLSLFVKALCITTREAITALASMLGLSGTMTAEDLARIEQHRKRAAERAEAEQRELARQRAAAAKFANWLADEAVIIDASEHPYLARKGYSGFPVFITYSDYYLGLNGREYSYSAGCLFHAIRDANGDIISAELVDDTGRKTAIVGGSKGGAVVIEPDVDLPVDQIETVYVTEGVATAYAVRELLGGNCIGFAGLSKNGLLRAAEIARNWFPEHPIIVAGDVGAELEAERAAAAVGGTTSYPPSGDDWDTYRQEVAA